jgi:glycine hydroxymethyltransferase
MVPFDKKSPMVTSGIRIGTPALTTRGFKENEMVQIARLIDDIIRNIEDEKIIEDTRTRVSELCSTLPLYEKNVLDEVSQL